MIELGQMVKDRVTGFEGIAVARVEYLSGCIQYCVKPKAKEGEKMPEGEYIDVGQLEFINDGISEPMDETPGGVMPDTPKS